MAVGVLGAVVVVGAPACSGSGEEEAGSTTTTVEVTPVCELIRTDEVEGLVGDEVRVLEESDVSLAVGDSVCLWADADPAAPGHVLQVELSGAGQVERPEPGPDDVVYDLPGFDDDAFGVQRAGGGVAVVFTVGETLVEMSYEVLPWSAADDAAIDRLTRLARTVRARLAG